MCIRDRKLRDKTNCLRLRLLPRLMPSNSISTYSTCLLDTSDYFLVFYYYVHDVNSSALQYVVNHQKEIADKFPRQGACLLYTSPIWMIRLQTKRLPLGMNVWRQSLTVAFGMATILSLIHIYTLRPPSIYFVTKRCTIISGNRRMGEVKWV